jgi:HSP20 family protein
MVEIKHAPKPKVEPAKGQSQVGEIERSPSKPVPADVHLPAFMHRFAEEVDRLFEDFGLRLPSFVGRGRELLRRETGLIPAEWSPRVDVRVSDGRFLVRADLPGLSKEDIHVDLTEEVLTIRGERKKEQKGEREGYSYSECSYGGFYRAIPLPGGVDTSKATAEFCNGVLEVAMPAPHAAGPQARRIEIQEKK